MNRPICTCQNMNFSPNRPLREYLVQRGCPGYQEWRQKQEAERKAVLSDVANSPLGDFDVEEQTLP